MPAIHYAAVTRHDDAWVVESLSPVTNRPEERPNGWVRRLATETGDAALGVAVVDALNATAERAAGAEDTSPAADVLGLDGPAALAGSGARRVMIELVDDAIYIMPMLAEDGGYVVDPDGQQAEIFTADTAEVLAASVRAVIADRR